MMNKIDLEKADEIIGSHNKEELLELEQSLIEIQEGSNHEPEYDMEIEELLKIVKNKLDL